MFDCEADRRILLGVEAMALDPSGRSRSRRTSPGWDRNGDRLAFITAANTVAIADLDRWTITDTGATSVPASTDTSTSFSPDGSRVAFVAPGVDDTKLVSIVETSPPYRVTALTPGTRPAWSPAGSLIAFNRRTGPRSDVFTMRANGTGIVNRTKTADADEIGPSWSPDGALIVFNRIDEDADPPHGYYVMKSDGSGLRPLFLTNSGGVSPAWSPSGRSVAVLDYDGFVTVDVTSSAVTPMPLDLPIAQLSWGSRQPAPVAPRVEAAELTVAEGDQTVTIGVPVRLSTPADETVTVRYAIESTDDVAGGTGVLTMAPGELTATIPLSVLGDTDRQSDGGRARVILYSATYANVGDARSIVTVSHPRRGLSARAGRRHHSRRGHDHHRGGAAHRRPDRRTRRAALPVAHQREWQQLAGR